MAVSQHALLPQDRRITAALRVTEFLGAAAATGRPGELPLVGESWDCGPSAGLTVLQQTRVRHAGGLALAGRGEAQVSQEDDRRQNHEQVLHFLLGFSNKSRGKRDSKVDNEEISLHSRARVQLVIML